MKVEDRELDFTREIPAWRCDNPECATLFSVVLFNESVEDDPWHVFYGNAARPPYCPLCGQKLQGREETK